MDICCYMLFENMKTWDTHYKIYPYQKFQPICEYLGLGKVVHFVIFKH